MLPMGSVTRAPVLTYRQRAAPLKENIHGIISERWHFDAQMIVHEMAEYIYISCYHPSSTLLPVIIGFRCSYGGLHISTAVNTLSTI